MLLQPIGLDVLQDLADSGDLSPTIAAQVPTLVFPEPILTWTAATANGTYFENQSTGLVHHGHGAERLGRQVPRGEPHEVLAVSA